MAREYTPSTSKRAGVGGRPPKMTPEVISKLNEAFAIGASDGEACFYANISHETLYKYQEQHPEFTEEKNRLKERPVLMARQSVIDGLKGSPELALKFLERKRRKEFALRTDVTSDDKQLPTPILSLESMRSKED